jgi:hypothetical protein
MRLHWGSPHFPVRKIYAMIATDSGMLNFQLTCGHVLWMMPKLEAAQQEAFEIWQGWEEGKRDLFVGCGGCAENNPVTFKLGTPLPIPMSPEMFAALRRMEGYDDEWQDPA